MTNNSPSLNDLIKNALLEKGWQQLAPSISNSVLKTVYQNKFGALIWVDNNIIKRSDGRSDGKHSVISQIVMTSMADLGIKSYYDFFTFESLSPADPQFFEKLEEWLK